MMGNWKKKLSAYNWEKTAFYCVMALLCVLLVYHAQFGDVFSNYELGKVLVSGGILKWLYTIAVLAVVSVAAFCILKKNLRLEMQYLILAGVMGAFYLFALPYNSVPDEHAHFLRIYSVTEGYLLCDKAEVDGNEGVGGAIMDSNLPDYNVWTDYAGTMELAQMDTDKENGSWYSFPGAALYAPVSYTPQVIGMSVAKLFTDNVLLLIYAGRIGGYLFTLFAVYMGIKVLPFKKHILFLVALMPTFMQEAVSLASDSFTNAISILLLSYVLYLAAQKETVGKKEIIILSVLCICMTLCKIVYLPLIFSVFMIPAEKMGGKKRYFKIFGAVAGVAVIVNLLWLALASGYLMEFRPGVDSGQQVMFVLSNPVKFLDICYSTYLQQAEEFLHYMCGAYFQVPRVLIFVYLLLILAGSTLYSENSVKPTVKISRIALLLVLAVIALISASLYVQWTSVGANQIEGIQGRYFIPLIMLLPLVLPKIEYKKTLSGYHEYVLCFVAYTGCVVLQRIMINSL